jgi:hypothetical protein
MSEVLFNLKQQTPEWHELKHGKIGGTRSKGLFIKGDNLFLELLSEHLEPFFYEEGYTSEAMKNGNELEPLALRRLEMERFISFENAGWIQYDKCNLLGMSPDGITKDLTIQVEIKCPQAKEHTVTIFEDIIPLKHIPQCVHAFTVNDKLEKLIFVSYRPESKKDFFQKEINLESEVNIGTKARPKIKKVSELVKLARAEGKQLELKINEYLKTLINK